MRNTVRNSAIAAAVVAGIGLGGGASTAEAANWILLQGTEPFGKAHTLQMWGFMQPTYRYIQNKDIKGTPLDGKRPVFNTVSPDRSSNQSFSVFRARIGARGVMHPVNDKINYFFLATFDQDGLTRLSEPGNGTQHAQLSDASVTFRQLAGGTTRDPWNPGVSLRFGQFKVPTADEGSRGIMSFDYINFSEVTRQEVLERYVKSDGTASKPHYTFTGLDGFRTQGIQLFDEIKFSHNWEGTWAVSLGNGNGINRNDNDSNLDLYLRAQVSYVFGGVKRGGPRRQDLKLFAWSQTGKRRYDSDGNGVYSGKERHYDRDRYGVGFHFYKQPYRLSGEYIWGKGMVFTGVKPPVSDPKGVGPNPTNNIGDLNPQYAPKGGNEFNGYYLEGAYFLIPNKFALQARYDVLNRLTKTPSSNNPDGERKFETITLGLQYWNHPVKGQWMLNYRIRNLSAPNMPSGSVPNKVGDAMGNEIGIQYFLLFKNVALR